MNTKNLKRIIPPVYYDFHNSLKNKLHMWYILNGGRNSGKSSVVSLEIVIEIVRFLMQDEKANILVVRRFSNTLNDSVVAQIEWALQKLGVLHEWRKFTQRARFVHKKTGQMIRFVGLDDSGKLKGLKPLVGRFTHLWVEEYDQIDSFDDIVQVVNSIARPNGLSEEISDEDIEAYLKNASEYESHMLEYGLEEVEEDSEDSEEMTSYNDLPVTVFLTCNPPNELQHWVHDPKLFQGDEYFKQLTNYLQLPKNLVSRDFIKNAENVKKTNFDKYKWLLLGLPQATGGAIFKNFVDGWSMSDEEYHTYRADTTYQGIDFGFTNDPACFCNVWYGVKDGLKTIVVLDEIYQRNLKNRDLVEKIDKIMTGVYVPPIPCDSAEPKSIADLNDYGLQAYGVNKRTPSRDEKLKWLSIEVDRILIDQSRTPNAYREIKFYQYEKNKRGDFVSSYPDKDNHFIDALAYAMRDTILTNGYV